MGDTSDRSHAFWLVGEIPVASGGSLLVYQCEYCGALVGDRFAHRDWHSEVEGTAMQPDMVLQPDPSALMAARPFQPDPSALTPIYEDPDSGGNSDQLEAETVDDSEP